MKKKLFGYLKNHYSIDVDQLLSSGMKNGYVGIIDTKDTFGDSLSLVYTTQKDEWETDFYLFCISDNWPADKIKDLMDGLMLLIKENSGKPIVKSSYDKEWYYWEEDHIKLSFGIRSESTGFSMRISFPNAEVGTSKAVDYIPSHQAH